VYLGQLLESLVVMELLKQMGWNETPVGIFHFRDQKGAEVGIVLESASGEIVGVEVKSAATLRAEDFAGLRYLQSATPDRFRRGRLIHALLQHLPDLPAERRPAAARAWLDRPGHGLPAAEAEKLASDTLAVLAHPDLAPLFGPASRAEVPLTGVVGNRVIGGLVDRLAVLPDRVLIADFKTNRRVPGRIEDTPVLYLRQMAAYRAVLREIFPGRAVVCALVWTEASEVVIVPDALLELHAPSHARDAA